MLNVACLGILSSWAAIAAEVITSQSRALPTTERARRHAYRDPGVKELPSEMPAAQAGAIQRSALPRRATGPQVFRLCLTVPGERTLDA